RTDSTPKLRQETAALRHFGRAYDRSGSSASEAVETTRGCMSALPRKRTNCTPPCNVCFVPIVLQKSPSRLCEIEICNNRIGASIVLNRCCSFMLDLESIFRDQMPKILLQQYLPIAT